MAAPRAGAEASHATMFDAMGAILTSCGPIHPRPCDVTEAEFDDDAVISLGEITQASRPGAIQ